MFALPFYRLPYPLLFDSPSWYHAIVCTHPFLFGSLIKSYPHKDSSFPTAFRLRALCLQVLHKVQNLSLRLLIKLILRWTKYLLDHRLDLRCQALDRGIACLVYIPTSATCPISPYPYHHPSKRERTYTTAQLPRKLAHSPHNPPSQAEYSIEQAKPLQEAPHPDVS
jgi:hypothetical protein